MPGAPPRRDDRPLCRHCHGPVDWTNLRRHVTEIRPNVFECVYFCPHCRAVLEFASWQTGVSRRD